MTFQETSQKIKEGLKALLTAENTEAVTSLVKDLESLEETHKSSENQLQEVKDKLVDYVTKTSFGEAPKDDITTEEPLTLDEAIKKLASKYENQDNK